MQGISDKLRELTHYDHGASAVNQALYVIQDALQCTASHRSRFEENSLVWLIPACTPHVEPATTGCDDKISARAGAACAAEVSSLLQNTAVQRAARCQSSRQWSAAESLLTRQRVGSKSVRVRIGEHFIERIPAHLLPLFRLDFCRHHLQLPVIAMIFGDKTGGGQLVCFQSRREKKSGSSSIAPSVESGPLESAYVSSWETAAEAVALAAYSGVNRLIGDLRIVVLEVHMTEITELHRLNYSVPVSRGYTYVHTVSIPVDTLPISIDIARVRRESKLERKRMSSWIKTHNIGGVHAPTTTTGDKLTKGRKTT